MGNSYKKFKEGIKKGVKETAKFIGEYGPQAHRFLKGTSNAAVSAFAIAPQKRENLDLNLRPIGKKVPKGKLRKIKHKGLYLDYT